MASTRLRKTQDGRQYYEIIVSRGRGKSQCTKRWYVPEGWSKRAIENGLEKVKSNFQAQVEKGEIVTKKEQKIIDAAKAAEEARIKTVKEYAEQIYMPEKMVNCSTNTVIWYRHNLENYIYPAIGDMKMTEVRTTDIKPIILDAQKKGLSFRSVKGIYQTICQLFKKAYTDDVIAADPAVKIEAPKRLKSELVREKEAFDKEDLQYILKLLDNEPLKWRTFFNIAIETGCRRGEICGITWKNINMQDMSILIEVNICYEPHKGVYATTPKSGKSRIVFVSPKTMHLLMMMKEEQLREGRISKYVFTKQGTCDPINPQSPTAYMDDFAKKYGIKAKCNPHKFRHSWITLALDNGVPVASVSEAVGHSDISITMGYAHLGEKASKQTSDIVLQAIANE